MKIFEKNPPRSFTVGKNGNTKIEDCGSIYLEDNEQVSFLTNDQKEYDIVKKDWGFYVTPSLNHRLKEQGFRSALIKNKKGSVFIMIAEKNKLDKFKDYILNEDNQILMWLDEL